MSPFELLPAIDLLGGHCVRLLQGDYDVKTEYSDNPVAVATQWFAAGADMLHVVDLDAAKSGRLTNAAAITELLALARTRGARLQVGGGLRDFGAIDHWLAQGVARCVIGTAALDMEWMADAVRRFGCDQLVVALDGRDGKMAVRGWTEQTDVTMLDIAVRLADVGVTRAIVTDVARDGTLQGPNLSLPVAIQARTGIQCIASGGVRSAADVLQARAAGLAGVIAGRSLYAGTLDLARAVQALLGDTDVVATVLAQEAASC